MPHFLATVSTAGTITQHAGIGVDEIGPTTGDDTGVIASPWSRDLTADEIEEGEWDAILAAAGWTVVSDWQDHGGYWTATVERSPRPMLEYPSAASVILLMHRHTYGRRSGETFNVIAASRRAAAVLLGERENDLREETQQRIIATSMRALDAMCAAIGRHPDSMDEEPAEFATVGQALEVMSRAVGIPAGISLSDIIDNRKGQAAPFSMMRMGGLSLIEPPFLRERVISATGFPNHMKTPGSNPMRLSPETLARIRDLRLKPTDVSDQPVPEQDSTSTDQTEG